LLWHLWQLDSNNNAALNLISMVRVTAFLLSKMLGKAIIDFQKEPRFAAQPRQTLNQ
jgi:hypothetical protein